MYSYFCHWPILRSDMDVSFESSELISQSSTSEKYPFHLIRHPQLAPSLHHASHPTSHTPPHSTAHPADLNPPICPYSCSTNAVDQSVRVPPVSVDCSPRARWLAPVGEGDVVLFDWLPSLRSPSGEELYAIGWLLRRVAGGDAVGRSSCCGV